MTASQPNLVQLAKQGDPKAITALMSRHLRPQGVTVNVEVSNDCLQIFLESVDPPEQKSLVAFIRQGITTLGLNSINIVEICARKVGDEFPAWREEFQLQTSSIPTPNFAAEPEASSLPLETTQHSSSTSNKPAVYRDSVKVDAVEKVQATVKDAIQGLKVFATNPVGGLSAFYNSIGRQRALGVGITFAAFYGICLLFSVNKAFGSFVRPMNINALNLILLGAVQFISFSGASTLTRKIFRGFGSLEGDIFIAGASLLAPGFLLLVSSLLGVSNIEIILIASILSATYMILTLYAGCNQISKISEGLSPVAVVVMLLLSAWLSKIMISAAIESSLKSL